LEEGHVTPRGLVVTLMAWYHPTLLPGGTGDVVVPDYQRITWYQRDGSIGATWWLGDERLRLHRPDLVPYALRHLPGPHAGLAVAVVAVRHGPTRNVCLVPVPSYTHGHHAYVHIDATLMPTMLASSAWAHHPHSEHREGRAHDRHAALPPGVW